MNHPLFVAYSDTYLSWLLGDGDGKHPTNPVRAKLATELLADCLADDMQIVDPAPRGSAKRDLAILNEVHDPAYVKRTLSGVNGEWSGTNTLGTLWMKIRQELRDAEPTASAGI